MSTMTMDAERLGPVVGRANSAIFITTAVLGFLSWFAITMGTWLTLFALDNVLALPAAMRFPLAIAGLGMTGWLFWTHILVAVRTRRTDDQVALLLERRYGIGKNVLINTIQFEGMSYGERQRDFVEETAKAGSMGWHRVPLRDLWQVNRMTAWGVAFALLLSLSSIYVLALPKFADNALRRYFFPLSDVPPVGSASLKITPGSDVTIAEHESLDVTLTVEQPKEGRASASYPELFYKEGKGEVGIRRGDGTKATMEPVVGKPDVYKYVFHNARHSFAFRAFAGDSYTRSIQVTVNPAPKIAESRFFITPPAYTAQKPSEEAGPPHSVKCLPRSKVGIEVKLDRTAKSLRWLWPGGDADFEKTGDLTWKATVEVGDSAGAYDVEVKSADRDTTARIATGSIMLKTDQRPHVAFVDTLMSLTVVPGEQLVLQVEADDDYGMQALQITSRPAYGGSEPVQIRNWEFGSAPGEVGQVRKKFELKIDASIFAPGGKYFLEARCNDFCPDNPWAVSEPILLSIKMMDDLKADSDDVARLYAALERAIRLQKDALDGTRNLIANIDNVWVDMNRNVRTDDEIQGLLDQFRGAILSRQLGVRTALLEGAVIAQEKEKRMTARMKEIAEGDAVDANDRAFDSVRRPFNAGELKPAVEAVLSGDGAAPRTVTFDALKGRYAGVMILSPGGWEDKTWIAGLSLLGSDRKPFDTSGWKVLSARGGAPAEARNALGPQGWTASGRLPHVLVVDMGGERDVTGITCAGHGTEQTPKAFRLYLSTDNPPVIVPDSPDKSGIVGDLGLLRRVQESIYNQLLALKGEEAMKLAKTSEMEVKKALGEDALEQAPSVDEKVAEFKDKLKEWVDDHDKNTEQRKALMGKPPEDLTEGDKRKLDELSLEKRELAKQLKDWVDDMTDQATMDFADPHQVQLTDVFRAAKELAELAIEAGKSAEFTWNMDTMIKQQAGELMMKGREALSDGDEPGSAEAREDLGQPPMIPELPDSLPLMIPELRKDLMANISDIEQASTAWMNHESPSGNPCSDIFSSMSAAGKMGDTTPDPKKKALGRSNPGRSGQSDGQMVADQIPPVADSQVAMPNRMSNTPSEPGAASDDNSKPVTSIGLGKQGTSPVDFGMAGRLPPNELDKMKEFLGQSDNIRENIRSLMLALNRQNMPTTDLRLALDYLEQTEAAMKRGDGVEIRRLFDAAVRHANEAQDAFASAMELRAREAAEVRKRRAYATGDRADVIPEGYDDIISSYFKRLAEESTSGRNE